jgi:hypothetical protein
MANVVDLSLENNRYEYDADNRHTCTVVRIRCSSANADRINGDYDVRIVTSDGCILRSDKFKYEYSGLWSNTTDEHIAIYPNPFTETTTLRYHLNTPSLVSIEVYNASGALIFSNGGE